MWAEARVSARQAAPRAAAGAHPSRQRHAGEGPAKVEHVFAAQKRRLHLVIRTVGLARATTKITLANLAYNMRHLVWFEGRTLTR
jgi:hypothetical protein